MASCAMMPPMRNVSCLVSVLAVGLVAATACAPADKTSSSSSSGAGGAVH